MWSLFDFFPEFFEIQILDIGAAHIGPPPYQKLLDAKRCRILGFEPNQEACEQLNQLYGPPHRFFPFFVGDGKPATFHETNWALTCSLYEPNTPLLDLFLALPEYVRPVAKHSIQTTRLDDIEELRNTIDWVKIDIQGGELCVFENAVETLKNVVVIQTEVNFVELYKNQPVFSDIDLCLRSQGFQLHSMDEIHRRPFGPVIVNENRAQGLNQLLWADAIYTKDWMRLDWLSLSQLLKMAIILHEVYHSYDLVHRVLEVFDQKSQSSIAPSYLARLIETK